MELTTLSFNFAKENGYNGANDLYHVLLFFKEQKGLNFEVVKDSKGTWIGYVLEDPSKELVKEFGNLCEPRMIFQTKMVTCLTDEEALDLLISYFSLG